MNFRRVGSTDWTGAIGLQDMLRINFYKPEMFPYIIDRSIHRLPMQLKTEQKQIYIRMTSERSCHTEDSALPLQE